MDIVCFGFEEPAGMRFIDTFPSELLGSAGVGAHGAMSPSTVDCDKDAPSD